jgi:hypothetical protein
MVRTRFAVFAVGLIVTALSLNVGCGKKSDDDDDDENAEVVAGGGGTGTTTTVGTVKIALTAQSMASLPSFKEDGAALLAVGDEPSTYVTSFFKFECHWGEDTSDAYCPAAIKAELGGTYNSGVPNQYKPYKLSTQTLLGTIAHADMYLKGSYRVQAGTTDNSASFADGSVSVAGDKYRLVTTDEGGVADKYFIPLPNFYDRLLTSSNTTTLFHKTESNPATRIGSFAPRKGVLSGGSESAFFQSYATTSADGASGRILAYNTAGLSTTSDYGQRVVLLVNMEKHKFIVKQSNMGTRGLVVAGKGGIDMATGEYLPGAFYASSTDNSTTWTGCVDNVTQLVVADSACSDVTPFFDGDAATAFDAAAYLELTAAEATDLAPFLAFFATSAILTTAQAPATSADLIHFANSVVAAP